MNDMITFEKLVESIKKQLRPHITDDVDLSDSWLMDIINQSRGAMLIKKYVANENFVNYYQEIEFDAVVTNSFEVNGITIPYATELQTYQLPALISRIGRKNIDYLGSKDLRSKMIDYVSFNEFIDYQYHRFGATQTCYTLRSNTLMIRNAKGQTKWLIRALFGSVQDVPGFEYESSMYPIDEADIRQLEILTFQHIAIKLGMPVDVFNNGQDETKNAAVSQQVNAQQQAERERE